MEYPERLKKIKNAPELLYVQGNKELLNKRAIAIIGTRKPSERNLQKSFQKKESA